MSPVATTICISLSDIRHAYLSPQRIEKNHRLNKMDEHEIWRLQTSSIIFDDMFELRAPRKA